MQNKPENSLVLLKFVLSSDIRHLLIGHIFLKLMLVGAAYGTVGYTGETSSVTIVCCTELSRAHVK